MNGINYETDQLHVEVKMSKIKNAGHGLFALKDFKKDDYICSYEGPIRKKEYVDKANAYQASYLMTHEFLIGTDAVSLIVDAIDENTCFARYMNDPLDKKLNNVHESVDDSSRYLRRGKTWGVIEMVAKKKIKKGDELYLDYGDTYWMDIDRTLHLSTEQITKLRIKNKKYDKWFLKHFSYDGNKDEYYFSAGTKNRPIEIE